MSKTEKVILHEGLESIGSTKISSNSSPVFGNSSLNQIPIPSTVKEIGNYAFWNSSREQSQIILPENLEKLGDHAIIHNLRSISNCVVVLPASLTYIGEDNFPTGSCLVLCTNDYQIEYCKKNQIQYADAKEGIDFATSRNVSFIPETLRYEHTGKPILIEDTTVTCHAQQRSFTLKNGEHYTISYKKNKDCGTASIIFKGIGIWKGEKEIPFEIYRIL